MRLINRQKVTSAYSEGVGIFTAIRKEHRTRQWAQNLQHSLLRGRSEIESLYNQHYQELGLEYEHGDRSAHQRMKDITISLQGFLLRYLRQANEKDAALELAVLEMEIEQIRVRALAVMGDLYKRLSNSSSVPWKSPMNLTEEDDSDGTSSSLFYGPGVVQRSLGIVQQGVQLFLSQTSHSSAEFSIATNTTSLEPEQDSIDAGIPGGNNMDHILDAAHYFGELDQLEFQTAQTLGIEDGSYIAIHYPGDGIKCLRNWRTALAYLESRDFCGSTMSILIEDEDRDGVAKAFHVSLDDIDSLIQTILDTLDEELLKASTKRWMQKVLNIEDRALSSYDLVGVLRSLCGILSIGLVSFSGSHVCRFDANLWGKEVENITVGLEGYTFKPRKLACLDNFIGGPAWILGKAATPSKGVKISLTLQDLEELWGPVSLVGGTADEAPVIRTERGFIVPLPREQQSSSSASPLSGEIECHWVTEIPQYISDENSDTGILIRETSRILIGTSTAIEDGLVVNEKCKASMSVIGQQIAYRLQYPGTCKSRYVSDGYDLQFVGGQYITAGLMKRYKRIPKRTLKAMLIADCTRPDTRLVPLLKLRVGLEVSACTGNAQRVTLWDALRFSQTSTPITDHPTHCAHNVGDKNCISSCWTRWQSADEIDALDHKPGKSQLLTGVEARRVIINSILALEHSGVDGDGNLQVSWPFSNSPANCPVLPSTPQKSHNWFRVVKDTRDTSSFAVFSQRCLVFPEEGTTRPCSMTSKDDQFSPLQTTLSTRILAPTQKGSESGLLVGVKFIVGDAHLTVTKAVEDQLAIIATVSMNPLNPLRYRLREILPDAQAFDFKEHIWPDIIGGHSVPVFVH